MMISFFCFTIKTVYLLALPLWSEVEARQLSFTGNHWHDASEGKEIVKYKTNSQTRYEFGLPGKAVRGSYR